MTDKEKVEEYMCKTPFLRDFDGFIVAREIDIKHAYLGGLAEGRKEKWHDLREDPNDLPKKTGEYFTNIGLLYYDELCNRHFWYTPSCEACGYSSETEEDEVIAWCELPKFEGGKK